MTKFLEKNLLFIFPLIFFIFVRYGYQFNGLTGEQSHIIFQQTLLGLGEGVTYLGLYPLIGGTIGILFSNETYWLQFISALGFVIAVYATYQLYDVKSKKENLKPYFFVSLTLSPIMLQHGISILDYMFCLGLLMVTWLFSFRFWKSKKNDDFILASILFVLTLFSNFTVFPLLLVPLFWLIKTIFTTNNNRSYLIGALFFLALSTFFWVDLFSNHHGFELLLDWQVSNFFTLNHYSPYRAEVSIVPNLIFSFYSIFHPTFFLLGIILLFFIKPKKDLKKRWYLWVSILIFLVFVSGLPYQNESLLLFVIPFISMAFAPAFGRFYKLLKKQLKLHMAFTILLVFTQLGLFTFHFSEEFKRSKLEQQLSNYITGFTQKNIYVSGMQNALISYVTEKRSVDFTTKNFLHYQRNSLVVANENDILNNDTSSFVFKNWNLMNNNYEIRKIKKFRDGWALFELR